MDNAKFKLHALGLLIGYGLQFLAGMLLNLFVTIPAIHPGSKDSEYFSRSSHSLLWSLADKGGWALAFHVYLAIFLTLGSISLFIKAYLSHNNNWLICSSLAAIFTLGAFFNGLSFIDYNKNISSMIMAICWLVAVGAIVFGLLKFSSTQTKKQTRAAKS